MEKRNIGVSELRSPRKFPVDDCVCDITQHVWAHGWIITVAWFLVFFCCDPKFCSCLQPKPHNRFYAVWFACRQSRDIALLEGWNYTKSFRFSTFARKTPILRTFFEWAFSGLACEVLKLAYYQNNCIDSDHILRNDIPPRILIMGGPNSRRTNPRWRTAANLK